MGSQSGTYLLTWTTYGSWLPGDPRGFVSPVPDPRGGWTIHNAPGTAYDRERPALEERARSRLKGPEVVFDEARARVVVGAINEAVASHGLKVPAASVMRTHVHVVVSSFEHDGSASLRLFKGVASRRLSQAFGQPAGGTWWTRHGSCRLLADAAAISAGVRYVVEQRNVLAARGVVGNGATPTDQRTPG
jgi:REP element-mobilizing transposase RayT